MFTLYRESDGSPAARTLKDPMPGMLLGRRLGMGSEEVMQDMQQGPDMFGVVAVLGLPDVIGDHPADRLRALVLMREILGVGDRRHFRQVFMLGDGKHLLFGEVTEAKAIFKRNH